MSQKISQGISVFKKDNTVQNYFTEFSLNIQ